MLSIFATGPQWHHMVNFLCLAEPALECHAGLAPRMLCHPIHISSLQLASPDALRFVFFFCPRMGGAVSLLTYDQRCTSRIWAWSGRSVGHLYDVLAKRDIATSYCRFLPCGILCLTLPVIAINKRIRDACGNRYIDDPASRW